MTKLHITGYGKTQQTPFNQNNKLNHGDVKIWSMENCKEALTLFDERSITDTNYCAGQWKEENNWMGACTDKVTTILNTILLILLSFIITFYHIYYI